MEKVKISREQADLLDEVVTNENFSETLNILANWSIILNTTKEMIRLHHWYIKDTVVVSKAIIFGYEVEETPEDRVKARYERAMKDRKLHSDNGHDASESYWDAYGSGIFDCLNDLNIKIEGIN